MCLPTDSRVQHQQGTDQLIAHHTNPGRAEGLPTHLLRAILKCSLHQPVTANTLNPRKRTFRRASANTVRMCPWNVLQQPLIRLTTTLIVRTKNHNDMIIPPMGHNPLASDNNLAMANLDQNHPHEPGQHAQDSNTSNLSSPKVKHLHLNTGTPTNHEDVANVGYSRLCDTPNLLPRLIVSPKPLYNPYYWTAPLSEKMLLTNPSVPTPYLRSQDHSTLLRVLPMTQRPDNKTILTILPQKLAYQRKRVGRPASRRAAAKLNTGVYLISHPKLS